MTCKNMSYTEKLKQANKEAVITVCALAFIVLAWCVLGFGLSGLDIQLFHTPLWVLGGTLGIWFVAIVVCVVLVRFVFVEFSFDDDDFDEQGAGTKASNGENDEVICHD